MVESVTSNGATLFVGAPTRLGSALNDFVRTRGPALSQSGVAAWPNKVVMPALRAAIGGTETETSLDTILQASPEMPLFLSALYGLGRPSTALKKRELFPAAERMLTGSALALGGRVSRVFVAIEPLHILFMAIGRDDLFSRVRDTKWEAIYEIRWSDLVLEIAEAFPAADVTVLTPISVDDGPARLLYTVFGDIGFELAATPAGAGLHAAANRAFAGSDIQTQTGIDAVTGALLEERFREDVRSISKLERVRLI